MFNRRPFMILLYILDKLYQLMSSDTINKGKSGYNHTPFDRVQSTIDSLGHVLVHLKTISDPVCIEEFINSFTDDKIFESIKNMSRDLTTYDRELNMVSELARNSNESSLAKLRKFFSEKIDALKLTKIGIKFIQKHSQFCDKRKYFNYLNNMVLHRDELHKNATIVNMIYQQILNQIKYVEGLEAYQRGYSYHNFPFLYYNSRK